VEVEVAAPTARIRFQAVPNDGGIDLRIGTDDRTVVILKLSASELEDMVKVINDALNNGLEDEERDEE
jgi:hypothetical protein